MTDQRGPTQAGVHSVDWGRRRLRGTPAGGERSWGAVHEEDTKDEIGDIYLVWMTKD